MSFQFITLTLQVIYISLFFSDSEGGCISDPSVEAEPEIGGSQEAVPLGHDAALQQQQREPQDCPSDVGLAGKLHHLIPLLSLIIIDNSKYS